MHQGGVITADHDFDFRSQFFDQVGYLDAGVVLPGHGREPDKVGFNLVDGFTEIFFDCPAFTDQIYQEHVMLRIDISPDGGNTEVGQVERRLMDDDRHYIGHGYQQDFHSMGISMAREL